MFQPQLSLLLLIQRDRRYIYWLYLIRGKEPKRWISDGRTHWFALVTSAMSAGTRHAHRNIEFQGGLAIVIAHMHVFTIGRRPPPRWLSLFFLPVPTHRRTEED
jgi:hypothetical protein